MGFPKFRDLFSIVFENPGIFSGQVFFSFFGFLVSFSAPQNRFSEFFGAFFLCLPARFARARCARFARATKLVVA